MKIATTILAFLLTVQVFAQGRMSPPSNTSSMTTSPMPTNVVGVVTVSPNAPTIGASNIGGTNISQLIIVPGVILPLSSGTNNAPVGFEIRRATTDLGTGVWPVIGTNAYNGPGNITIIDTGLQPNTKYFYQVGAFN